MRCELCVRLMLSLLAPVFGTCEAVFARRNTKGPTGFVRDRAVAAAEAEANEALSLSARVLSPSRPAAKRSRPTQSVRLHFFVRRAARIPLLGSAPLVVRVVKRFRRL